MVAKYSRKKFRGFTYRFIIQFELLYREGSRAGEPHNSSLTIYSNSGSYEKLEDFVNKNKSKMVVSFSIVHKASVEQDKLTTKFVNDILKGI